MVLLMKLIATLVFLYTELLFCPAHSKSFAKQAPENKFVKFITFN